NIITATSSEIVVTLNYNNNGNPSSQGYLDYISVEATRGLAFEGDQFIFKNNQVTSTPGIAEYSLTNAANVSEIWDITNKYDVTSFSNAGQSSLLNFKAVSGLAKTYIAVTP